ncbi:DUF1819 family protein [Devosia sp.]|uniref:DUF1819 family protein n=1 Tax=Devosia sp. TaxID=1871048 RepID=UPI00262F5245|nr:DUF1819 family protein [Devosia sp.]
MLLYLRPDLILALKSTSKTRGIPVYRLVEEHLDRLGSHLAANGGGVAKVIEVEKGDQALLQRMSWEAIERAGMGQPRYKADIAGGSLQVSEARVVAGLLLAGASEEQWRRAISVDNVLQKRSAGTANRQATLIRNRLQTMGPDLWRIVQDGTNTAATHAMLACAIKHSPLLADFLHYTVRESFRLFRSDLPRRVWTSFIDRCHDLDPAMPQWADSTTQKLGDSAFRVLHEAGYLTGGAKNILQPVRVDPEVMGYLRNHDEMDVIIRLQVSS